ncbi:MAG: bifunctional DNA-formamidopyrimidine glycosylase/DNA-(apurinic or apyrimidinic site) lyase [Proteobacteria bacterium]|nr:bifunctional DNA-formamidopyrimidine glycosylase/DNA-(apurinic or apyrimidinic site) lyase [Pseudomonadota bacterium]
MPELPEVETTCRGIAPFLIGHIIQNIKVHEPRLRWPINTRVIQKQLKNQRVLAVSRRAKYIIVSFSTGNLVIHLGMSGTLAIVNKHTLPRKHDHFECFLNSGKILRFNDPRRFGAVLFEQTDPLPQLAHLGIEPLDKSFTVDSLYEQTQKHRSNIKTFLMNQRIIVGIGNIYANECLFLAKIHPQTLSYHLSLTQCKQLHRAIQQVLKKAIKSGGTTLKDFYQYDGKPGYFSQALTVYDREDQPCYRCQSPVKLIQLGQRATYFCSQCQLF